MNLVETLLFLILFGVSFIFIAVQSIYCRLGHVLEALHLIAQSFEKLPVWQILMPTEKCKAHVKHKQKHMVNAGREERKDIDNDSME